MSKHDDDRITSDDLLMNQESFEQMIDDSHDDEADDDSKERFVSFAQQRRAERLKNWSKKEK